MADICFQTNAFPTDPEGDLEYCNGVPGSQLAGWLRDALLKKGYTCRDPLQEDYGWGFYLDADGCSLWISVSHAMPVEGQPVGVAEWHVGVDCSLAPWPFRQWLRRRRGRELEQQVFATVKEMIASHPGVTIVGEET
jgi:hypothetical protein